MHVLASVIIDAGIDAGPPHGGDFSVLYNLRYVLRNTCVVSWSDACVTKRCGSWQVDTTSSLCSIKHCLVKSHCTECTMH